MYMEVHFLPCLRLEFMWRLVSVLSISKGLRQGFFTLYATTDDPQRIRTDTDVRGVKQKQVFR